MKTQSAKLVPFCASAETAHDVGYVRHLATGNVIITRIETGVRIVCLPGAFRRITGVDIRNTFAGRLEVGDCEMKELGFIREEVTVENDNVVAIA